jgi:hypothetical protein
LGSLLSSLREVKYGKELKQLLEKKLNDDDVKPHFALLDLLNTILAEFTTALASKTTIEHIVNCLKR